MLADSKTAAADCLEIVLACLDWENPLALWECAFGSRPNGIPRDAGALLMTLPRGDSLRSRLQLQRASLLIGQNKTVEARYLNC
jgi:hypothetical protein